MVKKVHLPPFFQPGLSYGILPYLYLILLFATATTAQSTHPFIHYSDENGLSNNYVSSIHQDSNGFIWIGTQYGLNKFDGHDFKIYTSNSKDTTGLKANWILSITEAKDSTLWIGTYEGGLSKFDPVKEVFTTFTTQKDRNSIQSNIVNKVKCDSKGRIWVGTPKGISLFIPENNNFKRLAATNIVTIEEDNAGHVWIVTEETLMYFNESDQSFKPVRHPSEKIIASVIADKEKGLWVLSGENTLIHMETNGSPAQLRAIDSIIHTRFGKTTPFSTFNLQPVILSPGKQKIISFIDKKDKLLAVTEDHQHNIWIGTESGIKFWSPYTSRFNDDRFNKAVAGISTRNLILDGSHLWFIENETLYKWNILGGENKPQPILNNCSALFQAKDRAIYTYIKNPGNLYKIDPDTHKTKTFYLGVSADIFSMAEDNANRIWIGVWGMLSCFDPAKEDFVLKFEADEQSGLTNTNFLDLLVDDSGNLWMGDPDKGLFVLPEAHRIQHTKNILFKNYDHQPDNPNSLSNNLVQALHKDEKGNIWIGTDAGLNKFRPEDKDFQRFSKKDGLTNDKIITITSDASGKLWTGTISGGLFCMDTANNSFQNFTTEDGLHSNAFRLTAVFRTPDGTLLFGTENGIQIFHPSNIFKDITYTIPVYLTELQINGEPQSVTHPPDPLLNKHINFTRELVLKPRHNTITFRFAALHYSLPKKTAYFYQLEGIHDTLRYAGKKHEVTFSDLPPGEYTLRITGTRKDLGWTATTTPLNIKVLRPWWSTWWAWSLYIIIFFSSVTAGFIFRLKRLKTAQEKAAQLRELARIKNEAFNNIAHEFRSPLAVILSMNKRIINPGQLSNEKIAATVARNGYILLHRINQLLDLAKSETGKLPPSYIQDDIIAYLDYITESFYPQTVTKNIQLHFLSEKKSLVMDYDPDKLLSIFANLLSNAFKYTPENGDIFIHINTLKERNKEILQLKIQDTGIGIPADKIPYIFDRFYQIGDATVQTNKGTGIGLALAKELTERMGGTISVKSRLNNGSQFIVRLPVSRSAPIPSTPGDDIVKEKAALYLFGIHQPSAQVEKHIAATDAPIILIIDDNPDILDGLAAFLSNTYNLQLAYNGREGIEKAIACIPDIIISDVMMPEKNGFEVCDAIKKDKRTSHIPVILLTAKADENTRHESLERGAYHFLTKPVNEKELLIKLRNLMAYRNQMKSRYSVFAPPARVEDRDFQLQLHFMQDFKQKVAENYHKTGFNATFLAESLNMGKSQLYRKLGALTDEYTPASYIRTIRLNKARELLLTTDNHSHNISEIAAMTGYEDLASFTHAFTKEIGISPSDFRKKNRDPQQNT